MTDEIETISEEEYAELAQQEEMQFTQSQHSARRLIAGVDPEAQALKEEYWASKLCSNPDDPANV